MCLLKVTKRSGRLLSSIKMKVIRTNRAFEELSGFSQEEVLTWTEKECSSIVHPMDLPGFILKMRHIFSGNCQESISYAYRARRKDGQYMWVKILVTGIKESDGTFSIVTNYAKYQPKDEIE